jgi:monoamine oxidase
MLAAALADVGLKSTPTAMVGASRFDLGFLSTRPGRFPPLNAVALGELFDALDEVTTSVHPHAPWLSPSAERLDAWTAADWAAEHLRHPDARLFFPLFLGEMMAADPASVSVLHMAFYLRSGGGTGYLNAFEGGAQQDRVEGGSHQLAVALAARLGDRVRLSQPVRAIHQDHRGALVHTAAGTYPADAVVVAVPPLLADDIEYRPGLPVGRAGPGTGRGCAIKVHLVYPAPLWRDAGLSGWSLSSAGPMQSTVDDSPPGVGVLTGFVTGAEAIRFSALTAAEQRASVRAQVSGLFPDLPPPTAIHVTDWVAEPYSRGCYAALFGPGDWHQRGPNLTTAHLRVHWAGTETSTEFFGLMEGAIRSGHRVASEIRARY